MSVGWFVSGTVITRIDPGRDLCASVLACHIVCVCVALCG